MENKRVVWLDALKGFAIFLVVLGHCIERVKTGNSTNPILEQTDIFIYGFHMMLFFMISGYIYGLKENKRNTPEPFWHFTKVKLIDYGIPYLIFAVLVWGGKFIFSAFVKFQVSIKDLLLVFVNPVAFTWFLYILLWVSVIVKALDLLVKDRKKVWFITLIMVVVGMIFKTDIKLVDRVLLYTIAYYTGTLISSDFENKVCKNKLLLAVLAVLFIGFSIGRGFVFNTENKKGKGLIGSELKLLSSYIVYGLLYLLINIPIGVISKSFSLWEAFMGFYQLIVLYGRGPLWFLTALMFAHMGCKILKNTLMIIGHL